ncbi:glycosyltransferase family protein [Clostridium sp. D2Q-11]|uniref:Glycosyltransferase family protein n=1 Tax=Anaeromonas frigoriresistens TaxID=2683708 RepID=A0A942URA4_9FIRM|nr:glycosyltransferase family protein [Anaeromonas frigoriresistens]MBS4537824.1 glycosyltransferase family protein [Anaeromonas frigoriresistens]
MSKVIAIIQARMGSSRLPGKVLLDICGKSVLEHDILRIKQSKEIDQIIIATTESPNDDDIVKEVNRLGIKVFRGSEEDVLSRYYHAAKENNGDIIVRITSDCPLIDPKIVDEIIKFYKDNDYDIVTNGGADLSKRTYPRGLDTEVFTFKCLEEAYNNAQEKYQREHVTPYIYENDKYKKYFYMNDINYSKYRWTLDTEEDFELIKEIYKYLYNDRHDFYLEDIVRLMKENKELININKDIEQKKIK